MEKESPDSKIIAPKAQSGPGGGAGNAIAPMPILKSEPQLNSSKKKNGKKRKEASVPKVKSSAHPGLTSTHASVVKKGNQSQEHIQRK